jgi:hypothetical protein
MLLGIGACGPARSLDGLPPPCVSGYAPCASSGLCVRKLDDADRELERERQCSYFEREVRQGGSLVIAVPGAKPDQLPTVTTGSSELIATPRAVGDGVVVDLQVQHAAALGDVPDHKVKIEAMIGGARYTREFVVLVQAIAASPDGLDTNEGSESSPFRTFRKAASVAERGDTIVLRNDKFGLPSEPTEKDVIVLPAGVTVHGQVPRVQALADAGAAPVTSEETYRPIPTKLGMPIQLAGSATLDNLAIFHRLTVTTAGSTLALNDVEVTGGVALASSAESARVIISGGSVVTTLAEPNPILVEADDATLSISGNANIGHGQSVTPAPVIRFTGRRQHLAISGDVRIQNINSAVTIQLDDAQTVEIEGRAGGNLRVLGRVEIAGVDSMVTVKNAEFTEGINGGSGIVFEGDGASSLRIEDSKFQGEGITVDGIASKTTVRRTSFGVITHNAIRLLSGALDLGTKDEPGGNRFLTKLDATPDMVPVALQIDALEGAATITSSASTFDGSNPGPCQILGPTPKDAIIRGFWRITHRVAIDFY